MIRSRKTRPNGCVRLLLRQLRGKRRVDDGAADHVDDVHPGQEKARQQRRRVQADHRLPDRGAVEDQHHRRRDQDAERAAGADHPGGQARVVVRAQHGGIREHPHQRNHGADDAGRGREQGAGDQRRHRDRCGHVAGGDLNTSEQSIEDIGALDHVAHEQEQGQRDQDVVGHDLVGLLDHEIEDPKLHGVEAEEQAERQQAERNREAEHDDDEHDAQHHQGDLRVGHGAGRSLMRASSSCTCRTAVSISSTSCSRRGQAPSRTQMMQRITSATPWTSKNTPASGINDLSG